uniref:Uncharacterized protein n=1 Tax=Anguilla anguilla TaxID=7936 RepID=A0A0E9V3L3_ANGAN
MLYKDKHFLSFKGLWVRRSGHG